MPQMQPLPERKNTVWMACKVSNLGRQAGSASGTWMGLVRSLVAMDARLSPAAKRICDDVCGSCK